jgi:hypothetical protein
MRGLCSDGGSIGLFLWLIGGREQSHLKRMRKVDGENLRMGARITESRKALSY